MLSHGCGKRGRPHNALAHRRLVEECHKVVEAEPKHQDDAGNGKHQAGEKGKGAKRLTLCTPWSAAQISIRQ